MRTVSRLLSILRSFGPAAIATSATIGAGETVLCVRAGAWGGYGLLWIILLSTLIKGLLLLYLVGRHAALSGESIGERLLRLPGPRGWYLVFILAADLLVAPAVFAAIAAPSGYLLGSLFPQADYRIWSTLFCASAIVLAVTQGFRSLERTQVWICLVLLAGTLVAILIVGPDWGATLRGTLSVGLVPEFPAWASASFEGRSVALELATVFGYAGNLSMGYVVYSRWVLMHGWRTLTPIRADIGIGAVVVFVVTALFMVAGAAVLHPLQKMLAGFELLTDQRAIWGAIHPILIPIYYVVILSALWGTLNSLPEIYARVTHEFLGLLVPRVREVSYSRFLKWVGGYCLAGSLIFVWAKTLPVRLMDFVALFSNNLAVAVTMTLVLWMNRRLPEGSKPGVFFTLTAVGGAAVLWLVSGVSFYEIVVKRIVGG